MAPAGTVFVVDNDRRSTDSLRFLMQSEGFLVRAFYSAKDFLDYYEADMPGCLVLDLRMPDMCGLQLQEQLNGLGQPLPIIFLTAYGDIATCRSAMKAGAFDYFQKPFRATLLCRRVCKALEFDARRRQMERERNQFASRFARLSGREMQVASLLYDGLSQKQISLKLGITVQTTSKHRINVLEKLDIPNEVHLARLLDQIPPEDRPVFTQGISVLESRLTG